MRSKGFLWAALAASGVVVLQTVWVTLNLGGERITTAFTDIVAIPVPIAASIACWLAARTKHGRIKHAWIFLGAGTLSWALGECIWTYYEVVLGQEVPFPGFADIGFLGQIPLAAAAMLCFNAAPHGAVSRVKTLLDGMIIGSSMLFVSWATVLGPLYKGHFGTALEQGLGLAYPAGDLCIISIVLFVAARSPRGGRGALTLIGSGLLSIALADSLFVALSLTDSFASGGLIDVGWTLGFVLIGLAGFRARSADAGEERVEQRTSRLGTGLPFGAVFLAMTVGATKFVSAGAIEPFLFWTLLALIITVVVRQFLTLIENLSLNRNLEAKVQARTAELQEREKRFRSLVQNSSDLITIVDRNGFISYQSSSAARLLRYDPEELTGTLFGDLIHPEDRATARAGLEQALARPGSDFALSFRLRHRGGHWRQVETAVKNLIDDPAVAGIVLNTRDVTERAELEEQLAHQAFHDSLTGLANRALFRDRVEHAIARTARLGEQPGVLFLDLDGFKTVNDSLGHSMGDRLLIAVAERLTTCVRPGDTVARLGGDEFAILIEATADPGSGPALAERLMAALREPIFLENREIFVKASVGIAFRDGDGQGPDELLRNADLAMYMAKANGKNGFRISEQGMHTAVLDRLELEADLLRATERGEFRLQFQSIMDLRDDRLEGFEALLRWDHPRRGLVSPDEFIPIAESTGLIVPIGRWVLREACRLTREWQERFPSDPPLRMSVNLSGRQVQDAGLVADVADALRVSGLDPGSLVLEITESVVMDDSEATIARLHELKELGVLLAIDDFGTGYSSLSYLGRFPVDILKIDRAFVSSIGESTEDSALVRAIIKLAHTFHLQTVAEGIEDLRQLELLVDMGCTLGQGYYFSQAVDASALESFFGRRHYAGVV